MRQSPTQAGSDYLSAVGEQRNQADKDKLLKARLQFVEQLNKGDSAFLDELPQSQPEQNTLVRLANILLSKPGDGPFVPARLHRISKILKVLGGRIKCPDPANWFLEFDIYKQLEMVSMSRSLSPTQRSLATSILGIYPVVPVVPGMQLPIFVPYDNGRTGRTGNRNWQMSRQLLENKFQTSEVQNLKRVEPAVFLSYEILLGKVSSDFAEASWTNNLWRSLYHFYHQSCMNLMVEVSKKDELNVDRSLDERSYATRMPELHVDWPFLLQTAATNSFDRLSIKLIQAMVEDIPALLQQFQQELIHYSRTAQYEDAVLRVMSILYKHTRNSEVRDKLLELAEGADQVEAFLPLLPNEEDIVRYFEMRKTMEPQRIRYFPAELRNRLAESCWKLNPQSVMELEGSFQSDAMQLHVLESLPELPLEEMKKALDYIQKPQQETAYRMSVGTNNLAHFKELVKEWSALYQTRLPLQSSNDKQQCKRILKLLQSKVQTLQSNRVKLLPPRLYPRWLLYMLKQIFAITATNGFTRDFVELSKEAFAATASYLHTTLPPLVISDELYPELAAVLCHDITLIGELSA